MFTFAVIVTWLLCNGFICCFIKGAHCEEGEGELRFQIGMPLS